MERIPTSATSPTPTPGCETPGKQATVSGPIVKKDEGGGDVLGYKNTSMAGIVTVEDMGNREAGDKGLETDSNKLDGGDGEAAFSVAKAHDCGTSQVVISSFKPKALYTRDSPLLSRSDASNPHSPDGGPDGDSCIAGTNVNDVALLPPPRVLCAHATFELTPLPETPREANIDDHSTALLHKAEHGDPYSVLGPHLIDVPNHELPLLVIRFWKKDSKNVRIRPLTESAFTLNNKDEFVETQQRCDWLHQVCFKVSPNKEAKELVDAEGVSIRDLLASARCLYEVKLEYHNDPADAEYIVRDAYSFGVLAPDYDLKFFQQGSCWHVDNLMGSHIMTYDGAKGVRFLVWAPNAKFASVVGDWNQWDGRAHPMRRRHEFGVWEIFVPDIGAGEKYGYQFHSQSGATFVKIDPYAQEFENPPAYASIVSSCDDAYRAPSDRFKWTDDEWIAERDALREGGKIYRTPMSIYEVHLPSWMRGDNNSYLGYRELAHRLVSHLKNLNFTHVEFLPLAHHPFEGSWGYQISGQYAPYSRLGNPDDLKYLINYLHEHGIGVFLDFVPAHFCKDDWGLVGYDGQPLYEYADPREGEHKGWGTMVYNFRRNEVRSFLLGAAYHWLRRYHIDGLRIDAVSSMIYKNHCRPDGDWIPNEFGGDANLQAISLLQELNWVVHHEFPGVFTMAEESTSWQGVTDHVKGLGFDAKWDLGWMNDTLSYLCYPTFKRAEKHTKLTFRGLYMAHEKWVLPLSHDEVVSGKGSLLDKAGFAGTPFDERLRTLRALYGYQVGMPGRPLIFMGGEFGQGREWNESRSLDWHEAKEDLRSKTALWVSDLMAVYKFHEALHKGDDEVWNFQWVDCDNASNNLIAWLRKYEMWYNDVLVICHFGGNPLYRYPIGVPHGGQWQVLLNSDDWRYGGTMFGPGNLSYQNTTQGGRLGWPYCLWLDVPPFSCLVLKAPKPADETKGLKNEANNDEDKKVCAVEDLKPRSELEKAAEANVKEVRDQADQRDRESEVAKLEIEDDNGKDSDKVTVGEEDFVTP